MSSPFLPPTDTSPGGAGGGGCGGYSGGSGRVAVQAPPRSRPFPWPLPYSATQGAVGGAGGRGTVSVPIPPWSQAYTMQWPYQCARTGWLPTNPVRT